MIRELNKVIGKFTVPHCDHCDDLLYLYRQSSVDFINSTIEKNELQQEKVKLAIVVHPGGKKFMSLILDLICLAIKEVMKRKSFEAGKSIDLDKTIEFTSKMEETKKSFLEVVESETKKFKEISDKIVELIYEVIIPKGSQISNLEEFMIEWSKINQEKYKQNVKNEMKLKETYKDCVKFCETLRQKLSVKIAIECNEDKTLLPKLLHETNEKLSELIEYKNSATFNISREEQMKIEEQQEFVNKMFESFNKINNDLNVMRNNMKTEFEPFKEKVKELKNEAYLKALEEETEEMLMIRAQRDNKDKELLEMLSSPNYQLNFNPVVNLVPNEAVVNTRISLMEETENRERFSNSPFYQVPKPGMLIRRAATSSRSTKAISFNESMKLSAPSFLKTMDTRDLLDKATRPQVNRLNATSRLNPLIPRIKMGTTPKMSSTMLSATHFENGLFNCTGVSAISSSSPLVESPDNTECHTAIEVKEIEKIKIVETPMPKPIEMKISPRRQLTKQFEEVERNALESEPTFNGGTTMIQSTFKNHENKENMKNQANETTTTDYTFGNFKIKNDEDFKTSEDLCDVSDTVLNDIDLE